MHLFDRRRIGVVLAVVAALAVVALAARDDHTRDGGWRVPSTVTGTTQAMLVILFGLLAVGVGVLTVWALLPDGRPKLEPRKMSWLRVVSSLAVMVLLFVALANGRRGTVDEQPDRSPGSGMQGGSPGSASGEGRTPEWGLGLIGTVLLLGTAGVVALRRRSVPLDLPRDAPVVATEEERADAVAAADACADPRQSVLLAFAAAEALLSTDPATRRPPSTSAREWAAALRLKPLSAVVARYEIARFSHHAVTEDDRRAALDALARLR